MLANKDQKMRPILADMHMDGVYFDINILSAKKAGNKLDNSITGKADK